MLIQTNSYLVPEDKRMEHERLMRRVRPCMGRLGCDQFEVHAEVESGWGHGKGSTRFVQVMKFRDRGHHAAVQEAERTDAGAQELIREFCELLDLAGQRESGDFKVGYFEVMSLGA